MCICLSSTIKTTPINNNLILADIGLAAGQGALLIDLSKTFHSFPALSAGAGALIGIALRVAYKVNESILNYFFNEIAHHTGEGIALSIGRKVVEICAAAGVAYLAISLFVPSISLQFSTYLVFSALENIRPIIIGKRTPTDPTYIDFGPLLNISHVAVKVNCRVW